MLKKDFLVKLRKDAKLTRDAIEKTAGVPARTIGAYERGELKMHPSTEYANVLSSISGISPDIFNLDDIMEADIEKNKLTKFSQCLRLYMLWTKVSQTELGVIDLYDDEIFNWLINAKEGQTSITIKEGCCHFLDESPFLDSHRYVGEVEIINENDKEEHKEIYMIDLDDYDYSRYFCKLASKVVLANNRFIPSSFGIDSYDFADAFTGETSPAKVMFYNREDFEIYERLIELEKKGIEFNYENVKRSISEGVLLDDEEKELVDLWRMASYPLQQSILESLRQVREHDLKITREILESVEKHNAPKEE